MQKLKSPLLSISRDNYEVPKGEERFVHYKAERVMVSSDGERLSHPDLIKTNVKMFDSVKRNLELQGYTIEILFHPLGKYTSVRIPLDTKAELVEAQKSLDAKDAELAALRAELERAKASLDKEVKKAKEEMPVEKEEKKEEKVEEKEGEPKKATRSKKENKETSNN